MIEFIKNECLTIKGREERFFDKVRFSNSCWEWMGHKSKGYGMFWINGRMRHAHRLSYSYFVRNPGKLHVCHHCDNPSCINPKHLFAGTHTDNMKDMCKKGRHWNEGKTHCVNGHSFLGVNTIFRANGGRDCRICTYKRIEKYRSKRKRDVKAGKRIH